MSWRPRVSVGVPVFRGEDFLAECLESLLAQTFPDFEVIVSDNASPDGSLVIAREFAARDPRVRIHASRTNRGAAWNYNRVFRLARGEYFRWAAADDLVAPRHLEACVAVLDAEPDAVLCYPKSVLVDDRGRKIRDHEDRLALGAARPADRFRECLRGTGMCHPVFGLIRAAALERTALIRPYKGSDVVLLGELSLHGKFREVPERLFLRRIHEAMSSEHASIEEQQEFFAPRTRGRFFLEAWTHQREYLAAVERAPVGPLERIRLALFLFRRMVAIRSWLLRELRDGLRRAVAR